MEHKEPKKDSYKPLIVLLGIILTASLSLEVQGFDPHRFMSHFMGFFFLLFSMFKFFDLKGFANGFQMYDLIAKKSRAYAYLYPFLEFTLGVFYLTQYAPFYTNIATIILMTVSVIGVLQSMKRGYKFQCACLGTVLNVPLSTVTVVENVGMGLMAFLSVIA